MRDFSHTVRESHQSIGLSFLLLLHSGLRVNEALSLKGEDLIVRKLQDKEILFLKVREGKFGKEREVPMPLLSGRRKSLLQKTFHHEKKQAHL